MYKIKNTTLACSTLILFLFGTACKRFIEVDPPRTRLTKVTVFENDETAKSAVADVYNKVNNLNRPGISWYASLSADEIMTSNFIEYEQFNQNAISPLNRQILEEWNGAYNAIYAANALIEGLKSSVGISSSNKSQLIAEAKFLRAFVHYNLAALFGDIPYITTTDYHENGLVVKKEIREVLELIVKDLTEAQPALPIDFNNFGKERIRATSWAVAAMLARVYLYQKNFGMSEAEADKVIGNTNFRLESDLNEVFLRNSSEAIWQLMPPNGTNFPNEAYSFNTPVSNTPGVARLHTSLINTFESNDQRRMKWLAFDAGSSGYYPFKYKSSQVNTVVTEYSIVFRLAELYLIRAEARIRQGKLMGLNSGQSDINIIRERAGLLPLSISTDKGLLTAVEQERRVELFTEWGDRWTYLKHLGKIDAVLGAVKPNWKPAAALYPLPNSELLLNPNLIQNPGY